MNDYKIDMGRTIINKIDELNDVINTLKKYDNVLQLNIKWFERWPDKFLIKKIPNKYKNELLNILREDRDNLRKEFENL